jgi:MYXO-CTERM domain-containing protein
MAEETAMRTTRGSLTARSGAGRRLAALACLASAAVAAPAAAHQSNPDFVSVVRGVTPPAPGLRVQVVGGDDAVQIRNPGHHTVVVMGYDGEPYARLLPDGRAQRNARSPATYLNEDRYADVALPAAADADADPVWRPYTDTGLLEWHDHRAHWMGSGTPPQVTDPAARTTVFDYRIPIAVDGRPARIEGTLVWVGRGGDDGPPVVVYGAVAAGGVALVALAVVVVRRRRRRGDGGPGEPGREAW